jgi:hypothetical protein
MRHYRPKKSPQDSPELLEQRCRAWNDTYPVGAEVEYHSVIGAREHRLTKTRSAAYILSGHTAVCFVDGAAGCVALDALTPVNNRRVAGV